MTVYHMPESKTEEAFRILFTNTSSLSTSNIVTKFSNDINADNSKSTIAILANECEPDDDYLGNWTVKLNVMVMTPIDLTGSKPTNIDAHDELSGMVTDKLSTLLNNGVSSLNNSVSGLTVEFFGFGNRKQNIDGDYIVTDQSCNVLIIPS